MGSAIKSSSISNPYGVTSSCPSIGTTWSVSYWRKGTYTAQGEDVTWANAGDTNITGVIVSPNSHTYMIRVVFPVGASGDYSDCTASSNFISDNVWHNIVVTHNGSTDLITAYIDAGLIPISCSAPSALAQSTTASDTVYLAGSMRSAGVTDGSYDDLRIYSKILSNVGDDEVNKLYMGGAGTQDETGVLGTNLVAHWKMDDGIGTTLIDNIGAKNFTATGGGTFPTASTPGGLGPQTFIKAINGSAPGEGGIFYFGSVSGKTVDQGSSIVFRTDFTDRTTLNASGTWSFATDTVKVGQFEAMTSNSTSTTIMNQVGWATITASASSATVVFNPPFPNGLSSIACNTAIDGIVFLMCAPSGESKTGFNVNVLSPTVGNTRIYWQAWGY